jgi:predicted GH43/DUF377 family glycosyl hydrolase
MRGYVLGCCIMLAFFIVAYDQNSKPSSSYNILTFVQKLDLQSAAAQAYAGTKNPGMLKNASGYLVAYHQDHNLTANLAAYNTTLNLVQVDPQFKFVKSQSLSLAPFYKFSAKHKNKLSSAQDPRLFTLNDQLYMIYNDQVQAPHSREVLLAALAPTATGMQIKNIDPLIYTPGAHLPQKNWTPLVHDQQLYLIYSFDPYIVLHYDVEKKVLNKTAEAVTNMQKKWPYGIMRGSTPAIYVPEYDAYLTFIHSSMEYKANEPNWQQRQGPKWRIYYIGAVLLEKEPPFAIKAYTKAPLTFDGLYADKDAKHHIVFPAGVVDNGAELLLSVGYQDAEGILLKVNKQDLAQTFKFIR